MLAALPENFPAAVEDAGVKLYGNLAITRVHDKQTSVVGCSSTTQS